MKNYLAEMVDLTGDSYLNPVPAFYDNGLHVRNVANITSISVHHDASIRPHDYVSLARYRQEAREHYNRLGPGLQYHYKIDNTGTIFKIRPHNTWLYAVGAEANVSGIAICLDGYFHSPQDQKPTREQYEALSQLLIDLCEEHPEFPASYEDVWSHSSFSSTACCGDLLRPYVNAIDSKAKAQAIPDDSVYDWPALQPAPPPPPAPPVVVPPVAVFTYEDILPAAYVAQVKTHLDDAITGDRIKDYEPGEGFDMVRRMRRGDRTWLQTAYSVQKTPTRGVPEADLLLKNPGLPAPTPDPSPVTPPVPVTPPTPSPDDQTHDYVKENNGLLKQILALLTELADKIKGIFK